MKKLNQREQAIKQGYIDVLSGKTTACALRDSGKWTPTKAPKNAYKISFVTPDGLGYTGYPAQIEKTFFENGEINE